MKKATILTLITLCILSFASCGKQETTSGNESITATVESAQAETTVPEETETEESKTVSLPWIPLSSLETHPELRAAFEEYVEVTGTTGNKEGNLYTNPLTTRPDQNITLLLAIKNQYFRGYMMVVSSVLELGEMAIEYYADIDADYANAPYATINAYFELLPDQEERQFDEDVPLSRAQAMTLIMRAMTQVNEAQAPETDSDFTAKVGETQYTNFAAPMDEYAYVNTSTGLNEETFTSAMSRGEYIYLLANYYSQDYQAYMDNNGFKNNTYLEDVAISTVSDAGDIKYSEAISDASKGVPTDLYETFKLAIKNGYLAEAISDPGKGVPSDMYKAFEIATNMELISESDLEDWDAAITKGEAVRLFTTMSFMYYHVAGDGSLMDEIAENIIYPDVNPEDVDPKATNIDGDIAFALGKQEFNEVTEEYGGYEPWTGYAQSQGADGTIGWCWVYDTGKGAGSEESYAVYMKEGSPRYGEVFHVGDYLPDGSLFTGANHQEYRIAENRILLRMYENGELGGTIVTEDENGMLHIIVE